jgi:flagellin
MSVTINTNIPSIAASRSLHETSSSLNQAMERLSSGKRINGAKDDAAGMTVVTRMKAQITSLSQAVRNANDAISMISTYDGAADEIETILIRMRELATLAQNGTYTSADQANANLEYQQLSTEIVRIQEKTKFNGTLDIASNVTASQQTYTFQVGFTGSDSVSVGFDSLAASNLFAAAVGTIGSIASAAAEVTALDGALTRLNTGRAEAGAHINRLEHTVSNLMNVIQRTEEARSRIEDADFATESASLARANVLTQAGSAMLAQANQSPQYILALLRG